MCCYRARQRARSEPQYSALFAWMRSPLSQSLWPEQGSGLLSDAGSSPTPGARSAGRQRPGTSFNDHVAEPFSARQRPFLACRRRLDSMFRRADTADTNSLAAGLAPAVLGRSTAAEPSQTRNETSMSMHSSSTTPTSPASRWAACSSHRVRRFALIVIVVTVAMAAALDEPATVAAAGCLQAITALALAWRSRSWLIHTPRP